jgi:DNA-binding transcriptional MerR regulator
LLDYSAALTPLNRKLLTRTDDARHNRAFRAIGERLAMSNRELDSSKTKPDDVVWLDDTGGGEPPTDRILSLENVAEMLGVSTLRLRYYEFRGLIRRGQMHRGVHVYSAADCERVAFILKCRKAGLTLADIIVIIEATDEDVTPLIFRAGQETCMELVERLERQRKVLDDALSELSHVYAVLTARLIGDKSVPNSEATPP